MKKAYETPSVEKVEFKYRDQVVVASGNSGSCTYHFKNDAAGIDSSCFGHWESNKA